MAKVTFEIEDTKTGFEVRVVSNESIDPKPTMAQAIALALAASLSDLEGKFDDERSNTPAGFVKVRT